jgi:hypothetical protein
LGQTNRVGYAAQLNESPEVPARNVTRSHGRSVKIPVADLLAGVADAEGDAFVLQSIDATSAQGVPVSVDGAWLLYQAGATSPTNDTIGITVTDALGATTRGVMTITELSGPGQSAISRTLLRIETLPDNISIRVSFVGIPGRSYRVEATTNLTTGPWEPIGISTAGTNGLYSVVEAPSFLVPSRFYRVFQP